ncbi:MAG TPA: undecaprenyldiphospho-muramoylpentapeptide beta-N-acetylglucosaminyltransferase [Candidatus Fimadaptatus faecigallinarum]|uniref:UDP-N-acetylglucosamine--N-acetylmuramyl-(pentapeptide) pyrophosphoryl-undecaprenol N-acetylglucosamine transferase n=1 Tax=Candidatus Fimadaptatus faecigallinarum TaxID=2840814 RepID=A0A9D1LR78_9FIRM|nr:undecaprenyldiphospho-muramoylpentapeptide beta-N-acetylglucosaminyltransferase [Candidatus Fimadaptatus faecigallinarum]
MRRIVLTGGGTAGHVTPNLALIEALKAEGWDIHYIGTQDGIERELVERLPGVTYHSVPSGKLRRYFDLKNFTDPFKVLAGSVKAARLIGQLKPDIVFSKGGFVSVPVVYGAWLHRVPVIAHESDMTPGLSNRLATPLCCAICTTFPEAAEAAGSKGVCTGTPLRRELFQGTRAQGLKLCGFSGDKPVLLMTGGSLGAQAINEALRAALPKLLPVFDVVHLCGKGNLDESLMDTPGYRQFEYLSEELPHVFACCDVVVSRAGSNTLCEIIALRKPALLIPYPRAASRGDQILNAESFKARGLCHVLMQENMTPDTLVAGVVEVYKQRRAIEGTIAACPQRDGTAAVMEQIHKYARKR